MHEEYKYISPDEAIKIENEVIKLKLMLEHGASFSHAGSTSLISPETERNFLQYIMDFEQREALAKEMSVFEILGCPQHFPEVLEIEDERIGDVLQDILQFMKDKGIQLTVFSPNIKEREIYRFIKEELFEHRMLHIDVPGMITHFVYDEFHPDHAYENSRTAVSECLQEILQTKEMQWTFQFEQHLSINQHRNLNIEAFRRRMNLFKNRYKHIEALNIECRNCAIDNNN
ncbi:MAG: hypothetical protein ACO23V_05090, partial [Chitinophagaceae bacterium]